jgi:hypothetical protein
LSHLLTVMKKVPIMNPAMAAERVEMTIAIVVVLNVFLKKLLNFSFIFILFRKIPS